MAKETAPRNSGGATARPRAFRTGDTCSPGTPISSCLDIVSMERLRLLRCERRPRSRSPPERQEPIRGPADCGAAVGAAANARIERSNFTGDIKR
jgi:hypothetical protein